jgi:hypothetical protein
LAWPLLLVWLLVPVGVVAATSALDWLRLWHVRYVIGATPAALLLAACLPQWIHGRGKLVVMVAFALGGAAMSHGLLDWSSVGGFSQRGEDWRGAAEYLREQHADGGVVLLRSGLIEADALRTTDSVALRDYCALPLTALYRLPAEFEIVPLPTTNSGRLAATTGRRLAEQGGGWLVVRGSLATAEQILEQVQQEEAAAGRPVRIGPRRSFGRVQVMRLRMTRARSASEGNTAVWRLNDAPSGTLIPSLALRACVTHQPRVALRSR